MFELIPFDRHTRSLATFDPFRMLDDMDRSPMSLPCPLSART